MLSYLAMIFPDWLKRSELSSPIPLGFHDLKHVPSNGPHTLQHNGSLYSGHRILGFLQHRLRTADMGEWYVTIFM